MGKKIRGIGIHGRIADRGRGGNNNQIYGRILHIRTFIGYEERGLHIFYRLEGS